MEAPVHFEVRPLGRLVEGQHKTGCGLVLGTGARVTKLHREVTCQRCRYSTEFRHVPLKSRQCRAERTVRHRDARFWQTAHVCKLRKGHKGRHRCLCVGEPKPVLLCPYSWPRGTK